jgi:hypothetical protein
VAMQTAFISPTVFLPEDSCSGMESENPLPGGALRLAGYFPIWAKRDPDSDSEKVRVSSLPVVSSVQQVLLAA